MSNFPDTWQITSHKELLADQGIMQESSVAKARLGTKIEFDDGRIFRYSKAGGVALAAGKMMGSPIVATERDDAINAAAAVAIGAKSLVFTAVGTVIENSLDLLHVVNDTGEGLQYKIKSNGAATAAVDFTIELYDPIVTALAATSDCIVTVSPWTGLIITPDDVIMAMGVPTIPVTASYYYWSQTGGIGMCLVTGSTGVATTERALSVDVAAGVDGALISTAAGAPGTRVVAEHLFDSTDVVDTEYWPVNLIID